MTNLLRQAAPARLQLAEHIRQVWRFTAEAGTSFEDVSLPGFWEQIALKPAPRPQPGDLIEILGETGAFFAELLVRSTSTEGILTVPLRAVQLGNLAPRDHDQRALETEASAYEIVHRGQFLKWAVIRKSDAHECKSGMASLDEAASWLRAHLTGMKK